MEHRWGERFPLHISVRLNAGTTVVLGLRMSNASVSGGLVDTDVRLPVFSHVVVEFDVPGSSGPLRHHVPAYVVRHGHEGIGLEWQETMGDFAQRVQAREHSTPSTAQLSRGLVTSAIAQWRNYEPHLRSVLPVLQPWMERFGY